MTMARARKRAKARVVRWAACSPVGVVLSETSVVCTSREMLRISNSSRSHPEKGARKPRRKLQRPKQLPSEERVYSLFEASGSVGDLVPLYVKAELAQLSLFHFALEPNTKVFSKLQFLQQALSKS